MLIDPQDDEELKQVLLWIFIMVGLILAMAIGFCLGQFGH
jgi:hypothetical protein